MADRIIEGADIEQDAGLFDYAELTQDKGAYALRVGGGWGLPVVRDGECIVIEPHLTAAPTDQVVVVLKDGRTMLQELISAERDSITVVSLDRYTKLSIERSDIRPSFGVQVVTSIVSSRILSPE
jgi:phage repressor protein C with HTH and peptisase S24 domain